VILNNIQPQIKGNSGNGDRTTQGGWKGRIDEVEIAEELLEDTSVPACFVLSSWLALAVPVDCRSRCL